MTTALVVLVSGCESLRYYSQAVAGQWQIIRGRQSVVGLLQDSELDPVVQRQLRYAEQVRLFAREQLHLPVDGSYSSYVDLQRPYVVWNVFAAPALSVEPMTWCFPIAGCVGYRGYFSKQSAEAKAEQLRAEGFDAYVGGVAAYSTLGWFDDPLLNTFIHRSDTALAALLFHELAHKQLYVKGDTAFNESFATAVEQLGVRQWLEQQQQEHQYQTYLAKAGQHQQVIGLLLEVRSQLAAVYADGALSEREQLQRKQTLLASIRERFDQLNQEQKLAPYQSWLHSEFNNARLATIASYNEWVPAFKQLFIDSGEDFIVFYQHAQQLAQRPSTERNSTLAALKMRYNPNLEHKPQELAGGL